MLCVNIVVGIHSVQTAQCQSLAGADWWGTANRPKPQIFCVSPVFWQPIGYKMGIAGMAAARPQWVPFGFPPHRLSLYSSLRPFQPIVQTCTIV